MTQIRIDTEYVREIGRHLVNQGDRVSEIGQELQRAISSLDTGAWDGRSRARAEPMLDRVRPESSRVANRLEELGRKLRHVADTFEQEDNTAARNLAGMPWVDWDTGGDDKFWDKIDDIIRPRWPFPGPPPWWGWRPLPWPPRYWPWLPILPILPLLPPLFRLPWRWPRPGIPKSILPLPLPFPTKPKPEPKPKPQPKPQPKTKPKPKPQPKPQPKTKPKPITKPVRPLRPADDSRSCVWYARDRRPDLGAAGGSAQDYIDKYKDSVYQLDESQMQDPLQSSNVRPGHAIVWKAGSKGANETHGHVGIVEEVHADHIIISEANWNGPGIKKRKISKSDLQGLYFVP